MNLESLLSLAEGPPVGPTGCQYVPSVEKANVHLTEAVGLYGWEENCDGSFFDSDGTLILSNDQDHPLFGHCLYSAGDIPKRFAFVQDISYAFPEISDQFTPPPSSSPEPTADDEEWLSKNGLLPALPNLSSAVRVSLLAETLRLENNCVSTVRPASSGEVHPPNIRNTPETLSPDGCSEPFVSDSLPTPEGSPTPPVNCILPTSNKKVKPEPVSPPSSSGSPRSDNNIKQERSPSAILTPPPYGDETVLVRQEPESYFVLPTASESGSTQTMRADVSSLPASPSNSEKVKEVEAETLPMSCVPCTLSIDNKRKARAARKRQQNKDAAVRYRMRKQKEQKHLHDVCEALRAENAELLRRHERLTNEIAYVRGLVEEVMKARTERAASAKAIRKTAKLPSSS